MLYLLKILSSPKYTVLLILLPESEEGFQLINIRRFDGYGADRSLVEFERLNFQGARQHNKDDSRLAGKF
jgi:hypothetical protein